jgi:hypothetical protein
LTAHIAVTIVLLLLKGVCLFSLCNIFTCCFSYCHGNCWNYFSSA